MGVIGFGIGTIWSAKEVGGILGVCLGAVLFFWLDTRRMNAEEAEKKSHMQQY
jgi:hypothetical protein